MSKLELVREIFIKSITILFCVFLYSSYMSFIERRLLGLFQCRYGPNRLGPFGSMQLLADLIKILFKEDWVPRFSNRGMFSFSPIFHFVLSISMFSVVPVNIDWMVTDFEIGILFFLMLASLTIYPILLSGWSSNNKYSLLASVRAIAQTLSYEIFLGFSIMGIVMQTGSFNIRTIVLSQEKVWNILPQFFGFINFFLSGIAICHRHPFDHPESEQELIDGYRIEYSGMKFGLFFIGEYINVLTISALIVTLFFGGWNGPWLCPTFWFCAKTILFTFLFVLIRAALPRPKYNHIIELGWKICLPISLMNLLITAAVILCHESILLLNKG